MNILDIFKKKVVSDKEKIKDDQINESEIVNKVEILYNAGYKAVLQFHRDWYIHDRFIRGDHWIVFNKSLNTIQTLPISEGEIRRTINKTRVQVRSIKNFITRNDPTWEVIPAGSTKEAIEDARKGRVILRYYSDRLNLKGITSDVIHYSLKYSFGIYEIGVEDLDNDNVQDITLRAADPFDYVFDPESTQLDLIDCRYYIKSIRKAISEIKNNPVYSSEDNPYKKNLDNIKADQKYASAEYKDTQLKKKFFKTEESDEDLRTIILNELWLKYKDKEGETKIKVITVAGKGKEGKLLRVEDTTFSEFPIILYTPESDPGHIYSEAWIKDIIPINKSLDKTVSHVEGYIQTMLNGKILSKRGAKISRITDRQGEIVEYEGPVAPSPMTLQPLPSTPFQMIDLDERFIEDIGGVHESSMGRLPAAAQSGRSIEALQAADASNMSEATRNLESVLAKLGTRIFEILSEKQIVSKTIQLVEGEKTEEVKFIGKSAIEKEKVPEGTTVIDKWKVRVRIVPGLAYTEEAKREILWKLAELEIVDPQFILEELKTSSVSEIIERLEKRQEQKFVREGMLREISVSSKQGMAPGQAGAQNAVELADQENMEMAVGRSVPPTPDEFLTPEHHDLHLAFVNDPKNADKVARSRGLLEQHISEEKNRLQLTGAVPQERATAYQ